MRIFLSFLILIFSFQPWTKADDIRDFEIEGRVSDSALNFFSERDIKYNSKDYYKDKTFTLFKIFILFKTYDVDFNSLTGDKKYIFHNISGILFYDNNIQDCYSKMSTITSDIKENIKYLKHHPKRENKHRADKTGKSNQKKTDLKDKFIVLEVILPLLNMVVVDHLSVYIDLKNLTMGNWRCIPNILLLL